MNSSFMCLQGCGDGHFAIPVSLLAWPSSVRLLDQLGLALGRLQVGRGCFLLGYWRGTAQALGGSGSRNE